MRISTKTLTRFEKQFCVSYLYAGKEARGNALIGTCCRCYGNWQIIALDVHIGWALTLALPTPSSSSATNVPYCPRHTIHFAMEAARNHTPSLYRHTIKNILDTTAMVAPSKLSFSFHLPPHLKEGKSAKFGGVDFYWASTRRHLDKTGLGATTIAQAQPQITWFTLVISYKQ